jgi:hypothetical protein
LVGKYLKTDHYDHPTQFTYHNRPTIQQQISYAVDKANVITGYTMKAPCILTLENNNSTSSLFKENVGWVTQPSGHQGKDKNSPNCTITAHEANKA